MKITGTQTIPAARQRVWEALNDPEVLRQCLPGCESVERTSPEEFKVVMAAAIGPLRARFNGLLRMSDVKAPESCTMAFEGQGGAVGFGKGSSAVTLTEAGDRTELSYTAEAQVGGKLAQVGSRLVESVARKMADDFFKAFKARMAPPATVAAAAAPASSTTAADVAAGPPPVDTAAAPGSDSVVEAPASAAAAHPVVHRTQASTPARVMVPGWWLGIAALMGAISVLAGFLAAR